MIRYFRVRDDFGFPGLRPGKPKKTKPETTKKR